MRSPLPSPWLPLAPAFFAPPPAAAPGPTWALLLALLAGAALAPLLHRAADRLPRRIDPTLPALAAAPLRWRLGALAIATPLLAALAVARFGATPTALAAALLLWTLLLLGWIDAQTRLLPDALTLPLLAAGLAVNAAGLLVAWPLALLGAVAGVALLWLPQRLYRLATGRDGVGQGDTKLLAALGAWLGAPALLRVVLYAAVAAAVLGALLVATRRGHWQGKLAFGPLLAAAAALVLLG